MAGWRDSRPVRVGNDAYLQKQLDVYGEIFGAFARLEEQVELDETLTEYLTSLADQAAARWEERDHGIWEIRGEPRHYVHSKLMCWAALDRAVEMKDALDADDERVEDW